MSVPPVGGDADSLFQLSRVCSAVADALGACRRRLSAFGSGYAVDGPAVLAAVEAWLDEGAVALRRRAALLDLAGRLTSDHPVISGSADIGPSFRLGDPIRSQAAALERNAVVAVAVMRGMAAAAHAAASRSDGTMADVGELVADVPDLAADVVEASVGGVVELLRDMAEVADDVPVPDR